MSRESVVFYKSFYEAIKNIPENSQLEMYKMIFKYCFDDEIPHTNDGIAKAMFILMKPNIDSANARYQASVENGKKGGRPIKEKPNNNPTETQEKPNNNPTETQGETQVEPNQNLNYNVDVDSNVDVDLNSNLDLNSNGDLAFDEEQADYGKQKERKKKTTSYDEIIDELIDDVEIKDLIYEFVKMRKLKRKPLTDRALRMSINKLYKLSEDIEEQKQIIETTIIRNWDEFYPLKQEQNNFKEQKSTLTRLQEMLKEEERKMQNEQGGNN